MIICVDAGHGGKDSGAVYKGQREADLALTLALLTRIEVERRGHVCLLTRDSDRNVSLLSRCVLANTAKASRFLSIHLNADADPDGPGDHEARGSEILYAMHTVTSIQLARKVEEKWASFPALPYRGLKLRNGLFVLRHTKMPAILIEVGFVDSESDLKILRHPDLQKQIASLLAEAVTMPLPSEGSHDASGHPEERPDARP